MDCAGLRADIDKLKQELQALETNVEKIREAEEYDEELRDAARIVSSNSSDSVLEKYLEDFKEQNPEIFPHVITLGERIDIMDADGYMAQIRSIVATDDGRVLIGGGLWRILCRFL